MKVIDWLNTEEITETMPVSIGGLGGWFNWESKGMRWKDYIESRSKEVVPYAEAIRESVLRYGFKFGGDDHQNYYIPLFEDGTIGCFGYRSWGDLMAAIWSEEEDKDYSYMDFYMTD